MSRAALHFGLAGAILTAGFVLVGFGQAGSDRRRLEERVALTVARAVAKVAEGEGEAPGRTQAFARQVLGTELGVTELEVVKGTRLLAHHDEARAGARLDPESLADKALYDAQSRLKATREKNVEERERTPTLTKNAYPEAELARDAAGAIVVVAPAATGAAVRARVLVSTPPAELPVFPIFALLVAAGAFFALGRFVPAKALALVGAAGLVGLMQLDITSLAGLRAGYRLRAAEVEAKTLLRLAEAGLLRAAPADLGAAALAADPFGVDDGHLLAVRSATIGAAAFAGSTTLREGDHEVVFSERARVEARRVDEGDLFVLGLGLFVLAAAAFLLGTFGMSGRAARAVYRHRSAYFYMTPAMSGMAVLVFIPVVFGIVLGFMDRRYNVFEFAGLRNYVAILSDLDVSNPQNFYFKLGVTVLWTVTNVGLHVSIGLFLALLLNDQLLKARGLFRVLLIIPWAIPNYITALIWKGLFHKQFGAVNIVLESLGAEPIAWFQSFWPAFMTNLATNTWLGFPFMMVVSLGALQSIPGDLYEAAWVDGASRWQRFREITLPLLMPALVPAVIMGTVWTFNMFNIIYLVSGGAPNGATDILITDAFRWAFERDQYGYAAAYSTIIFLLLLTFTVATNRITGATKGAFD